MGLPEGYRGVCERFWSAGQPDRVESFSTFLISYAAALQLRKHLALDARPQTRGMTTARTSESKCHGVSLFTN
jgi:hypothetical protein